MARFLPVDHLRAVEKASGAPAWLMIASAAVMFASWTGCYYFTIRKGFRDRTYGIPIVNTALNVSWEFIFAFDLMGPLPSFYFPLKWGHRVWLIFDVFNVVQIFKYGRGVQTSQLATRWFYPMVCAMFLICAPVIYLFMSYFNDVHGVASATLIDLLMSVLFIQLYAVRSDLRGLSYAAAWLRTIGDVSSFVFLYYWWPAQFVDGVLLNPDRIPRFDNIQQPRSFVFLNSLFVVVTLLDVFYVYLLATRRRTLRARPFVTMGPDAATASS